MTWLHQGCLTLLGNTAFTLIKQQKKGTRQPNQQQPKPQKRQPQGLRSAVSPQAHIKIKSETSHLVGLRSRRSSDVPGKHCSGDAAGSFINCLQIQGKIFESASTGGSMFSHPQAFRWVTRGRRQMVVPQSASEDTPGGHFTFESFESPGKDTIGS